MRATNRLIVTSGVDFLGIFTSSHTRGKDALDVVRDTQLRTLVLVFVN